MLRGGIGAALQKQYVQHEKIKSIGERRYAVTAPAGGTSGILSRGVSD